MFRALALSFSFGILAAACTAPASEEDPPHGALGCKLHDNDPTPTCEEKFFWPTGLAVSPDESMLFVENANSDLTFDSGALEVVDLDAI